MATANYRSDDVGGIQELIQSMLSRQEQQFQRFLRENQAQNQSIFTELDMINRKLASIDANSNFPSLPTSLAPASGRVHPALSLPEASLGPVKGDNIDSTPPPEDGQRGFIHSVEPSLDGETPPENHIPGQFLLQGMEAEMHNLGIETPDQSIVIEDKQASGEKKMPELGLYNSAQTMDKNLGRQLPGESLMQGLDAKMLELGIETPDQSIVIEDKQASGEKKMPELGLYNSAQTMDKNLGRQLPGESLMQGLDAKMLELGIETPDQSIVIEDKQASETKQIHELEKNNPAQSISNQKLNQVPGRTLLLEMEKKMLELRLNNPQQTMDENEDKIAHDNKTEQGVAGNAERGIAVENNEEKRLHENRDVETNLALEIERQMEKVNMVDPMTTLVGHNTAPGGDLEQKIRVLEANAKKDELRCKELEERIQQLQASLKESQDSREHLQQQAKLIDSKYNSLRQQKEEAVRAKDEMAIRNKDLEEDKRYFEKKVVQQENEISELRPKADQSAIVQNRCDKLKAEMIEKERSLRNSWEERQQWFERANLTKANFDSKSSEVAHLEQQLKEHAGVIHDCQRKMREKDERIEQEKRRVEEKQGFSESQQVTCDHLERELQTEKNENKLLAEAKTKIEAELKKSEEKYVNLQIEVESKKNEEPKYDPYFYVPPPGPTTMYPPSAHPNASVPYFHSSSNQ